MYYATNTELDEFVALFILEKLQKKHWTHKAHLTIGIWHLLKYTKDEATCLIRARIIIYNEAIGIKNSFGTGYHETITLFWILVIYEYLNRNKGKEVDLVNEFVNCNIYNFNFIFDYYSKELLFSKKARAFGAEPDRKIFNF